MSQRPDDSLPYFSVVIPSFNSAAVLGTALDSIGIQNESCEVIVVDGASRDASVALANSHPLAPIVISESDSGIYDAINKGMARATGRLIGVLGSDDVYLADTFSRLRSLHERMGTDIVFGGAEMIDRAGTTSIRKDERYGPGALISGIPFCHNAMFVTPDAFRSVGSYSLDLGICADAHWVHRAIKLGKTASGISDPVVAFSLGGTSSVNDKRVMAETYQVIAENFDTVSAADAKFLIDAVRGWGPIEPAIEIARRHPDDRLLQAAIREALGDRWKGDITSTPSQRSVRWLPRLVSLIRG